MSSIQQQIAAFISGNSSEYVFPAGMSIEERKLIKVSAEKLGLSSRSFGMGSDRQLHIFKPASSIPAALEPVEYSVKNTFIDGPLDEQASVAPAHQSLPVGALQQHIAAEEKSLTQIALVKVHESPRNSEVDTSSTKDSDSEVQDTPICIKNTFVHFETDSKEHADPRIIQSMPGGTFAENIEADREAALNVGSQKKRPMLLSHDSESEGSSAMLFPPTPNAENSESEGATVPIVQWIPPAATGSEAITVLPSAFWDPAASPQPRVETESMLVLAPQGPPSQAPMPPQGQILPLPPQGPPQGLPPQIPSQEPPQACFGQGAHVVLQGLASQPEFNGLRGVVNAFDADCGRYNVMIEIGPNAGKRLVKVKFQNLLPAPPMLVPQVPYYPQGPVQQPVAAGHHSKASLVLDQMV